MKQMIFNFFEKFFAKKRYLVDPNTLRDITHQEVVSKLLEALTSSFTSHERAWQRGMAEPQDRCLSDLAHLEKAFPNLSRHTSVAQIEFVRHLRTLGKYNPSSADIDFRAKRIAQLMVGKNLYDYQVGGIWSDLPLGNSQKISLSECLSNPTFAIFRLSESLREDKQLATFWETHGKPPKILEQHEEFHLGFASAIHQNGFDNFLADLLKGIEFRTKQQTAQTQ